MIEEGKNGSNSVVHLVINESSTSVPNVTILPFNRASKGCAYFLTY